MTNCDVESERTVPNSLRAELREQKSRAFLQLLQRELPDDSRYEEFLRIMSQFKENRCLSLRLNTQTACKKVQDLFRANEVILGAFNRLIPAEFRVELRSGECALRRCVEEATSTDPHLSHAFDQVIEKWRKKEVSPDTVKATVKRLLARHTHLYQAFERSFTATIEESLNSDQSPQKHRKTSESDSSTPAFDRLTIKEVSEPLDADEKRFFARVKKILGLNSPPGFDYYNEFARCLDLYTTCVIIKPELMTLVEPLFEVTSIGPFLNSMESLSEADTIGVMAYLKSILHDFVEFFTSIVSARECQRRKTGWFFRPLSEINVSSAQRVGHSYFCPQRPRTACSHRSPLAAQCLNSLWVSVPYGSEDYSFRLMRKNNYEDALLRAEDERFESDLAVEQLKSTVAALEQEARRISQLSSEELPHYRPDALLKPLRLKPVFTVYGSHGKEIEELLQKDPLRTIPVVLERLRSKLQSWLTVAKPEKERLWAEVTEKNFLKSLDYRRFAFKQMEKNLASCRVFLAEAKTRYDHRFAAHKKLKEYVATGSCDGDYEFMGGGKNRLFYSSFAGMSLGVPHYLPASFHDELLLDSTVAPPAEVLPKWANARECGRLPQFRLLFNCRPVLADTFRLLQFGVDSLFPQAKEKLGKWAKFFDFDFLAGTESPQSSPPYPDFLPFAQGGVLLYAPSTVYVFFRFLHMLYERLLKVKSTLAALLDNRVDEPQPAVPGAQYIYSDNVEKDYSLFLRTAGSLLSGKCDSAEYEDLCTQLLAGDAYVLFTLGKLVNNTVKSLNAVAQDEQVLTAAGIFAKYQQWNGEIEERYVSEYCYTFRPPAVQTAFFRLLWNKDTSVLSLTYIESPYAKLNATVISTTCEYLQSLLYSDPSDCQLARDLRPMLRRMDRYFAVNHMGELAFARTVCMSNGIKAGFTDTSVKLSFLPGGEDFLYNTQVARSGKLISYVREDECLYSFPSKGTFIEKMSEISQRAFDRWHSEWLSLHLSNPL